MRQRMISLTAVTLFGIAIAGCGGAAPANQGQKSPEASASPAPKTPAEAVQQMAQGLQNLGKNQATPVDFEKLISFLPEPAGWTRSKPKGEQVSMGVSLTKAEAEYTKGDSTIKLEITDSSFNQLVMAPLSMMLMANYSERSSEGYKKYAAVAGNPGFETWQNDSKDGEVTVVVANRFIIEARGSNVPNIDPVKALVQAIDLSKLAALK